MEIILISVVALIVILYLFLKPKKKHNLQYDEYGPGSHRTDSLDKVANELAERIISINNWQVLKIADSEDSKIVGNGSVIARVKTEYVNQWIVSNYYADGTPKTITGK